MAVAFVKEFIDGKDGTISFVAISTSTNVTIGNLILMTCFWNDTVARTITTVTDNAGGGSNTYTQIGSTLGGNLSGVAWKMAVFWAKAKATETLSITAQLSGNTVSIYLFGSEFSGQDPTTPIDANNSTGKLATANASITITTIADNCMVWGGTTLSGTATVGAGYTLASSFDGNVMQTRTALKTPAGLETVPFVDATADDWLMWAISIQPPTSTVASLISLLQYGIGR